MVCPSFVKGKNMYVVNAYEHDHDDGIKYVDGHITDTFEDACAIVDSEIMGFLEDNEATVSVTANEFGQYDVRVCMPGIDLRMLVTYAYRVRHWPTKVSERRFTVMFDE